MDKFVLWSVLLLSAVGIVAVYSAIAYFAATASDGNTERFLFRHSFRVAIALLVMGVFSIINYHFLAKLSKIVLIVAIGLLVLTQLVGVVSGGAARWLAFGGLQLQPSDLARVALLLYVSVLLTQKQVYIRSFSRAFVPIMVWIGITIMAIGVSDLSTSLVVLTAVMVMCFVGRVNVGHIALVGVVGLFLAYIMLLTSPQRAARVESFVGVKLFPNTVAEEVFDNQDEGYQAKQALLAIANGGLTGLGPGKSAQRDFLPAPYNDFIFAIIAEEYGVVGALALLFLYVLILFRGLLRIARHAPDPLGLFLSVGIVIMLTLYGFVHAGVSSNLLPVTGLPLPFVSYGGTSMLANGVMIGILLNISRHVE
ncbi:putative peptidoglycan glycosyltransferase FtsW [uncultured Gimesia sp.]|uniref:FtsW/RodA/SpoVE family cell cycle protein n=1 Tax=uncultured Gimesia sp. TaxID=1678688 RepID=UPI002629216A|nr:putative peptidoglycan glycosyltransferase FtsW [uncultured Gimesia sp.]